VYTAKGNSVDAAVAHPLAWFTRDPFMRDDGGEFCTACTDQEKATIHLKRKARAEVHPIGTLRGFSICDVFYYFDGEDRIRWKSILVKTKSGQYREIYHLQPTEANIEPSFLVKAGEIELLGTRDQIPGSGAYCYEAYFQFGEDGAVQIDFSLLASAATSVLPSGTTIRKGSGLDLESLSYRSPVWKQDDAECCPTGGTLSVRFRVQGGRVVVTDRHFDPVPGR
jgi:hypothetical protein